MANLAKNRALIFTRFTYNNNAASFLEMGRDDGKSYNGHDCIRAAPNESYDERRPKQEVAIGYPMHCAEKKKNKLVTTKIFLNVILEGLDRNVHLRRKIGYCMHVKWASSDFSTLY